MSSDVKEYDLVVIGGGPAGLVAAITSTGAGKRVAVIEDSPHELGGAGINTGTVPSKTLRETALALSGMQSRNLYGVDLSLRREATVADFLHHERNIKATMNASLEKRLETDKTDVYYGTGSFVDAHTIFIRQTPDKNACAPETCADVTIRGEFIMIATGSSPVRPSIFPFDNPAVYDSDTILELKCLPKSLAVVGAGTIGSEYACTFNALGTQTHILDGRDVFMSFLDSDISKALLEAMQKNGIIFHWKETVESCQARPEGQIALKFKSGGELVADAVLVAAGRKSNVENLKLESVGVKTGEKGLILVDEQFRTNIPHIFATGDVIGHPALASTSMEQARRAVRHMFALRIYSEMPRLLPSGIYTIPEVGTVGETQETLKQKGIDYVAGKAFYRNCGRGRIIGETEGFLKLLFNRADLKLVGVHAMGERATDLVHIGLLAMLAGEDIFFFDEVCFNIPTISELYKIAAINAFHEANVPRHGSISPPPDNAGVV